MYRGFDGYGTFNEDTIKESVNEGFSFVPAYLMPEGYGKRMTQDDAQLLTRYGLKIANLFEDGADNALGGAEQGEADGAVALQVLKDFRVPECIPDYFAVDYNAPDSDMDAIEAYLRTAGEAIAPYPVGVYGSFAVVEEMITRGACKYAMQTCGWSHGQRSAHAIIYQASVDEKILDKGVDFDEAADLGGMWNYELINLVDFVADRLALNDPKLWLDGMYGLAQITGDNINDLFKKLAKGNAQEAIALLDGLNSPDYWLKVLEGLEIVTPEILKALFLKIQAVIA